MTEKKSSMSLRDKRWPLFLYSGDRNGANSFPLHTLHNETFTEFYSHGKKIHFFF